MARVKVTAKFGDGIYKTVWKVCGDEMARDAQKKGKELIQNKTRSGRLMEDPPGKTRRNPSLADSTISKRRYLGRYNPTHPTFKPEKSNLTITGQLIDAVTSRVTKTLRSIHVEFFVEDSPRQKYKGASGRPIGRKQPPTNKELANYQADKGRKFMALDEQSRKQLNNRLTSILRRKLRLLIK